MTPSRLSIAAFLVLASAELSLADVLVVAPAPGAGVDFTTIQAAVNAAAPNDLILVKAGNYSSFSINGKPLVITADAGHTVNALGTTSISNLAAGQAVSISGVNLDANDAGIGLMLSGNSGPVLIERCHVTGSGLPIFFINHAVDAFGCQALSFVHCVLSVDADAGVYSGLRVMNSNVFLYETDVHGGDGDGGPLPGAAAATVSGGSLFASGSQFFGGDGGDGILQGPFSICTDGLPGGAGLFADNGAVVRALGTTFVGGQGGAPGGPGCSSGPNGPTTQLVNATLQTLPNAARQYEIPSPVREGQNAFVTFVGQPNDVAFAFFSAGTNPTYSGFLKGSLLAAEPALVLTIGSLGPTGKLSIPVVVPISAGTVSFTLYEQALYYNAVGGFVLGNPRLGVVLDASL